MLHKKRRWCVSPAASPEDLAAKLTDNTWTLCTGFELQSYLFLNDSTSEDGAQEYAVLKPLPQGGHLQVESITFGWCSLEQAISLIHEVLAGQFDVEAGFGPVSPTLEAPGAHRCGNCA